MKTLYLMFVSVLLLSGCVRVKEENVAPAHPNKERDVAAETKRAVETGLAFLAKFASEHVHLPVELRLAAIAAAALVLLGVGWRLRESRSSPNPMMIAHRG